MDNGATLHDLFRCRCTLRFALRTLTEQPFSIEAAQQAHAYARCSSRTTLSAAATDSVQDILEHEQYRYLCLAGVYRSEECTRLASPVFDFVRHQPRV